MPFNGSGTYTVVYNFVTEAASAPIEIAKLDGQFTDIATALTNCILRDGTGLPTTTIDWNTQRITNLGNSTTSTGPTTIAQFQSDAAKTLGSVAGTNTITGSLTPALTAYTAGMTVGFTPANTITGAATLNINGLGALDILKADGDALVSGDLVVGIPAFLMLDSGADDWILLNPQASINGIATSDFARLSVATQSFSGSTNGNRGVTTNNSNNGASANAYLEVSNDAGRSILARITSTGYSGSLITGSPTGEIAALYTAGAVGLSIGTNGTERIRVLSDGSVINLQATAVQINGNEVVRSSSGTYTPSASGTVNVSSITPHVCQYMRVGAVVTVSGAVSISETSAANTQFELTLPVSSNLADSWQLAGAGNKFGGTSANDSVRIQGGPTNNTALFNYHSTAAGLSDLPFAFTYLIV